MCVSIYIYICNMIWHDVYKRDWSSPAHLNFAGQGFQGPWIGELERLDVCFIMCRKPMFQLSGWRERGLGVGKHNVASPSALRSPFLSLLLLFFPLSLSILLPLYLSPSLSPTLSLSFSLSHSFFIFLLRRSPILAILRLAVPISKSSYHFLPWDKIQFI